MIGVIFASIYLGRKKIETLVNHIEHIVSIAGIDCVGLGSDFDGFVPLVKEIRNVEDLPLIEGLVMRIYLKLQV